MSVVLLLRVNIPFDWVTLAGEEQVAQELATMFRATFVGATDNRALAAIGRGAVATAERGGFPIKPTLTSGAISGEIPGTAAKRLHRAMRRSSVLRR